MIGTELTSKQSLVVSFLASGQSITDAAKHAKIGEATIYRWQALPHFKTALQQARDDIRMEAIDLLKSQVLQSAQAIISLRDDITALASTRLKAAQLILEMTKTFPDQATDEQEYSNYDVRKILPRCKEEERTSLLALLYRLGEEDKQEQSGPGAPLRMVK